MKNSIFGLAISLPLCLSSQLVMAQTAGYPSSQPAAVKCDYSRSIGSCEAATAPRAGGGVFIFTDSLNCASVDYTADGRKRRVYVTEGRGEDTTAKEDISVLNCNLFAAIEPPKPVAAPQVTGQAGWQQPDGTVVGGGVPVLAEHIPHSTPANSQNGVAAPQQAVTTSTLSVGGGHQQLFGTWCDVVGQPKLIVSSEGMTMMHKAGKKITVPFKERQSDGMIYSTRRLFTTYTGKIGMSTNGQELVWDDRVSPGFTKIHHLRSCG